MTLDRLPEAYGVGHLGGQVGRKIRLRGRRQGRSVSKSAQDSVSRERAKVLDDRQIRPSREGVGARGLQPYRWPSHRW